MFRTKKNPLVDSQLPKAVSLEDGERAMAELRRTGGVDMDRFLEEIEPGHLFASRVGPTASCLTLDDLETYGSSDFSPQQTPPHLLECDNCRQALRVYKAVKERALQTSAGLCPMVWVEADAIELTGATVEFVLKLKTVGNVSLDPVKVSVLGVFDEVSCDVDVVESDALVGSIYNARCSARPLAALMQKLGAGMEFCDWLQVSGRTQAGQSFKASDLVRFHVRGKSRAQGQAAAGLRK